MLPEILGQADMGSWCKEAEAKILN